MIKSNKALYNLSANSVDNILSAFASALRKWSKII